MEYHAVGTFDVKRTAEPPYEAVDGVSLARMHFDKRFHGPLEASGSVEMIAAGTATPGSAGYVAIERVTGTLDGRSGTFVLQHSGTMNRGAPSLSVTDAVGTEGAPTPLVISAALVDADSSESLSITISGVPADVVLSAGTDNGDGSWTLSPAQLAGLSLLAPDDAEFVLTVQATATEASNGDAASATAELSVTVHNADPVITSLTSSAATLGGALQGRLWPRNDAERTALRRKPHTRAIHIAGRSGGAAAEEQDEATAEEIGEDAA